MEGNQPPTGYVMMTAAEVARRYGVSRGTVWLWRDKAVLPEGVEYVGGVRKAKFRVVEPVSTSVDPVRAAAQVMKDAAVEIAPADIICLAEAVCAVLDGTATLIAGPETVAILLESSKLDLTEVHHGDTIDPMEHRKREHRPGERKAKTGLALFESEMAIVRLEAAKRGMNLSQYIGLLVRKFADKVPEAG